MVVLSEFNQGARDPKEARTLQSDRCMHTYTYTDTQSGTHTYTHTIIPSKIGP